MSRKKGKVDLVAKIGVIYARYSSHAQKDASIEQQIEQCQLYALSHNISIVETYADHAVSGKTDRRAAFQKMLRDAEKGMFNCVIAWKSNRMGRNMLQAMQNEAKLNDLGVRVLYTEESFDDTAAGRFALRSMMNVNQFYSENMAEDIRRGMRDNAMQCKVTNGSLPFGYTHDKDLKYILDPLRAEIVREIFRRVAEQESFADIAADLNARGIRTARNGLWNKNSFHVMLHNERYTGVYIFQDIRVEGGIPQIIDKGLFQRVQRTLHIRKRSWHRRPENGDYQLTGKLFCGHCKRPMIGTSGTSKNGCTYFYYTCQGRRFPGTAIKCTKENVRREFIEQTIASAIKQYVLRDETIEWIADRTVEYLNRSKEQTKIGMLEKQLSENKRVLQNLMNAIEQGLLTETMKARLLELEKEQAVLRMKLEDEKAHWNRFPRNDILSAIELYRNGNLEDIKYQGNLFNTFLVSAYLYDNQIRIHFNLSGQNSNFEMPIEADIVDSIETLCSDKLVFYPPSLIDKKDADRLDRTKCAV